MGRGGDDDDMGDKLVATPDFDGPTGKRHCTDILCSILLIASWIAMTALGIYAVNKGDYRIVLYPLDYDGNICGTDFAKNMNDYPFLYYINNYGGGVCVAECPALENQTVDNLTDVHSMITYGGLFLTANSEIDANIIKVANYSGSDDAISCTESTCIPSDNPFESWNSSGVHQGYGFAYFVVDSYPILNRCTSTSAGAKRVNELTKVNSTLAVDESSGITQFWNQLYTDIWIAQAFILGFGFGIALLVSFGYIYVLRIPFLLSFVIWSSIFLTIAMFIGGGYYTYTQAQFWDSQNPVTQSSTTISATRYVSYALFLIGAILIILMCCLRKQIQLAIGCVKETGKAITRMPLIMVVPVVQATGFIAFMVVFTVYGVYLASLAKIVTQDFLLSLDGLVISVRVWSFDDDVKNMGWYLLFCLFWYVSWQNCQVRRRGRLEISLEYDGMTDTIPS